MQERTLHKHEFGVGLVDVEVPGVKYTLEAIVAEVNLKVVWLLLEMENEVFEAKLTDIKNFAQSAACIQRDISRI